MPEVALSADGLPSPESFRRHDDLRLSRKEVLKIAEITEELLAQLEDYGLVDGQARAPVTTTPTPWSSARPPASSAEFGIEPRHLRAFKAAADREVGLVEQVVAPQRRATDAAAARPDRGHRRADRGPVAQAARHLGEGAASSVCDRPVATSPAA